MLSARHEPSDSGSGWGHSDASSQQLTEAIEAGAEGFTHLGNGCPPELHRHDNIVFRVMDQTGLRTSLIPDRIHVSPLLFRILDRALGPDRICLHDRLYGRGRRRPGRLFGRESDGRSG